MTPNIARSVRDLIAEYRSFPRTSYRFLDPHLRRQFDEHLQRAGVVVKGPPVSCSSRIPCRTTATSLGSSVAPRQRGLYEVLRGRTQCITTKTTSFCTMRQRT